jgi:anti-sigma B factor antagonist
MKLSYEDHHLITVLTLSGELTSDQGDAFRRACQERFSAGIRDVVLNLEHLKAIDSAGLEMLLWLVDQTANHHGQVRLVNPEQAVRTILYLTRLDRRFAICDSVELAARSLR